jgi:hypothetical protein
VEISVLVDSVEHKITPTAGDLVRLEREYSISAASLAEDTVTVEHVLFLSWSALRRTGLLDREIDFDAFIDLADVPESNQFPPPPLPES